MHNVLISSISYISGMFIYNHVSYSETLTSVLMFLVSGIKPSTFLFLSFLFPEIEITISLSNILFFLNNMLLFQVTVQYLC